jgi:hypothetical protein
VEADRAIWQARVPPRSFVRHIQLTIHEWQLKRELDGQHSPQLRQLRWHLKLLEQFSHGTNFTVHINATPCERDGATVEDGDERPHECKLWKRDESLESTKASSKPEISTVVNKQVKST